jgi:hypothetical protein
VILKANELRKGNVVYDSKNRLKWFVKDIGNGFITLKDMDPPIETDGAPVYFHTTWRIRSTSDILFLEASDAL